MTCKLGLALTMVFALVGCAKLTPYTPLRPKPPHALRIASYNVDWGHGLRRNGQPWKTIAAIRKTHADIVFLQETTPLWQQLIQNSLAKQYPYRQFRHYPNAGGLTVLAKYPFTTRYYIPPIFGWHPYWILTVNTPLGNIQCVNIHLTPPLESETSVGFLGSAVITTRYVRQQEIHYIYHLLKKHVPTILAGDFNEGDGRTTTRFLRTHGFQDALATLPAYQYTWRWRIGILLLTDRFDHVFYNAYLKVIYIKVLRQGDSDHFPVIVDFKRT